MTTRNRPSLAFQRKPDQSTDPCEDPTLHLLTRELLFARSRARLTQADVAWRMGTTKSAISRLESSGGHRPSFATLERYAEAVGCRLEIRLRPLPIE